MRALLAFAVGVSLNAASAALAPEDWNSAHTAGFAAVQQRNYDEAMKDFRESWSLAQGATQRGASANEIGQTLRLLGQPKEARQWLEKAWNLLHANPGTGRYFATATVNLADLYRDTGDLLRAEPMLRDALSTELTNPDATAKIRNCLGGLLRDEGRNNDASQLFLQTLSDERISPDSRAAALTGLAVTRLAVGDIAQAEPLLRRALAMARSDRNDPSRPPTQAVNALSGLALIYRAQNKLALAEDACIEALELERAAPGEIRPRTAPIQQILAGIYAARGEREKARDYATQALTSTESVSGGDSLPAASALANRAHVEVTIRDNERAAADYQRALNILRVYPGQESLEKSVTAQYAHLLENMHRDREAKALNGMAKSFHN